MIRRINFTERRRIPKEHVKVTVFPGDAAPATFSVDLSLSSYELPTNAKVLIEAYRQTAWMRFDYGTIGNVKAPADLTLREFPSSAGVHFRLKVVEPSGGDDKKIEGGKILAQATRIRPKLAGQERRESLLHVDWGDFDAEVWRVEFSEDSDPILKVSKPLVREEAVRGELLRSDPFVAYGLPSVLRMILSRILYCDDDFDPENSNEWQSRWIQFARQLPGVGAPPAIGEDSQRDDCDDWIDDCVTAFARKIRTSKRFQVLMETDR